jgi:hypothetical protein
MDLVLKYFRGLHLDVVYFFYFWGTFFTSFKFYILKLRTVLHRYISKFSPYNTTRFSPSKTSIIPSGFSSPPLPSPLSHSRFLKQRPQEGRNKTAKIP